MLLLVHSYDSGEWGLCNRTHSLNMDLQPLVRRLLPAAPFPPRLWAQQLIYRDSDVQCIVAVNEFIIICVRWCWEISK